MSLYKLNFFSKKDTEVLRFFYLFKNETKIFTFYRDCKRFVRQLYVVL